MSFCLELSEQLGLGATPNWTHKLADTFSSSPNYHDSSQHHKEPQTEDGELHVDHPDHPKQKLSKEELQAHLKLRQSHENTLHVLHNDEHELWTAQQK